MTKEEVVFCTDLTDEPEEYRHARAYYPTVFDKSEEVVVQYHGFMHEAEVLIYSLVNAVEEGEMTADEARQEFEPYREHMPWIYDPVEMEEYESGFPDMGHFIDWGIGPGTSGFWEAADEFKISGVYYNEGEHPGGNPVFYIHRKEALGELREAMSGRYKIVARDPREYDASDSSDLAEAKKLIERARANSEQSASLIASCRESAGSKVR